MTTSWEQQTKRITTNKKQHTTISRPQKRGPLKWTHPGGELLEHKKSNSKQQRTETNNNRSINNYDEHVLRSLRSHKHVCHNGFERSQKRPFLSPFWPVFWGSKKGLKIDFFWALAENFDQRERYNNKKFLTEQHQTTSMMTLKHHDTQKTWKNTKKWPFFDPSKKGLKTAKNSHFWPFLKTSKNS